MNLRQSKGASSKASGNKSTELKLIKIFRKHSIRGWRRNYKIIGKPDFVFSKLHLAIFVDGCFWHGHNCRNVVPQNNASYWANKVLRTQQRDKLVSESLLAKGWTVVRIWECELCSEELPEPLASFLTQNQGIL